ncbi:unnamed protein product [Heligmosomoides polygyrus]|uniref:Uncharacterized protein n=1 Tax=Heligmosomoides polygyrus TaxID=6339 RepID=A0A183F2D1_HELPZ|nr:unnamed protein product [Heligmosomoides polygyrus]
MSPQAGPALRDISDTSSESGQAFRNICDTSSEYEHHLRDISDTSSQPERPLRDIGDMSSEHEHLSTTTTVEAIYAKRLAIITEVLKLKVISLSCSLHLACILKMFRVNNAALNSPGFASSFFCPPGSQMNPRERCSVC